MAPVDQPDSSTNKSSLLWAYHLRQENIHLVDRIDSIGADLASANEKTLGVQQSFSNLESRLKTLEAENHELRDGMKSLKQRFSEAIEPTTVQIRTIRDEMTELRTGLESATLLVKAIEEDAAELRAGLSNVENKYALIVQKHIGMSRLPLGELTAEEIPSAQGDARGNLSQKQADKYV